MNASALYNNNSINKFLYGVFFIVIVPLLLWLWASKSQCTIPIQLSQPLALSAIIFGLLLCCWSMAFLSLRGQGLPMNAFPPLKFVSSGPYIFFSHPIYVGFSIALYGFMAYFQSSSGFFIVAPVVTLSTVALAIGYENYDLKKRFVTLQYEPFIGLIEQTSSTPNLNCKIRFITQIWLFILFFTLQSMAIHSGNIPLNTLNWMIIITLFIPLSSWFSCSFKTLRLIGLFWVIISALLAITNNIIVSLIIAISVIALLPWCKLACSSLANSWTSWTFGPVRIINHGLYLGLAVFLSFGLWDVLLNGKHLAVLSLISSTGLISAGLWGQALEGSNRLKRPFGYFGGVIGGSITLLLLYFFNVDGILEITAALVIAFSFGQSLGRLRCLVNGCCHGGIAPSWAGIKIHNPQSRAAKISELHNLTLHLSQIYSLVYLFIVGSLLLYLWSMQATTTLILGLYLILAGIGRFIEEATRGEIQTKIIYGLRIYQWLSILMLIIGAFFTCVKGAPVPAMTNLAIIKDHFFFYLLWSTLYTFAFGIDFPGSRRRYSEL